MADPRLNSVHLEAPRRQEFRRAREALLNARGEQTLNLEYGKHYGGPPPESRTLREGLMSRLPAGSTFVLMDKEAVYPLKIGLNTVGRLPDNDVVLTDPFVSRRHCAILVHAGDGCELHDVASKNGTYLNGQKLNGPTRLVPGDELRMCERQFIFMSRADLHPSGGLPPPLRVDPTYPG